MTKQTAPQKPLLNVVSKAHHQPFESILQQISMMDQAQLGELLRAIAHRIYPTRTGSYRRNRD